MAFAAMGQQAAAQVHTVTDETSYKNALTDATLTNIKVAQDFTLSSSLAPYNQTSTAAITFESADGNQYTMTGGGAGSNYRAYDLGFSGNIDLNALRNVRFDNFRITWLGGDIAGAAMRMRSVLGGMDKVWFHQNSAPRSGGGFYVRQSFAGGIKSSRFTGNESRNLNGGGFAVVQNFSGGITDTVFDGNTASIQGGGFYAGSFGSALNPSNISGTTFTNNSTSTTGSTSQRGGGFYVSGDFFGSILNNTTFEGNSSVEGGGFYVRGNFTGEVRNTTFSNNTAALGAGMRIFGQWTGGVVDSRFVENVASGASRGGEGGALIIGSMDYISGSTFIGNQARNQGGSLNPDSGGKGGALYFSILSDVTLSGNTFLNNTATTLNPGDSVVGGRGGAIYYNRRNDAQTNPAIEAAAGGRSLFYGNTHQQASNSLGAVPNAIHFANNSKQANSVGVVTFDINAVDTNSRVLMLDPMSSQGNGLSDDWWASYGWVDVDVTKTGTGNWVLGGVNDMRGAGDWNIQDGTLTLASITYNTTQTTPTAAEVNLLNTASGYTSHFTLGSNATLAGSGTVRTSQGNIAINGAVRPSTWVNTGLRADQITSAISQDDIDAIDVTEQSGFGHLTFASPNMVNFGAGFEYHAHIDPGVGNDRITILGNATIDAAAKFFIAGAGANAWVTGNATTILDATGTLTNHANLAAVDDGGNVTYNANLLDLLLMTPETYQDGEALKVRMNAVSPPPPPPPPAPSPFAQALSAVGVQTGATSVLNALETIYPLGNSGTSNAQMLVNAIGLTLTADNSHALLNTLAGEIYGSTHTALLDNYRLRNMVQSRILSLGTERQTAAQPVLLASNGSASGVRMLRPSQRLWANVWGYTGHVSGNRAGRSGVSKADQDGIGLALGGDAPLSDRLSAGAVLGFEDGKVKTSTSLGRARTQTRAYSLGGYVSAQASGLDLQGGVFYSYLDLESRRNVGLTGLPAQNRADFKGYKVQAFAEVAMPLQPAPALTLAPYLTLSQSWLHTHAAQEYGTGAPATQLALRAQTDHVFQTTLGVRASWQLPDSSTSLNVNLGWAHAFGDTHGKTTHRFANMGATGSFVAQGMRLDKNRALVGLGLQAQIAPNTTVSVGYDGQFGRHLRDHAGSVQVQRRF